MVVEKVAKFSTQVYSHTNRKHFTLSELMPKIVRRFRHTACIKWIRDSITMKHKPPSISSAKSARAARPCPTLVTEIRITTRGILGRRTNVKGRLTKLYRAQRRNASSCVCWPPGRKQLLGSRHPPRTHTWTKPCCSASWWRIAAGRVIVASRRTRWYASWRCASSSPTRRACCAARRCSRCVLRSIVNFLRVSRPCDISFLHKTLRREAPDEERLENWP